MDNMDRIEVRIPDEIRGYQEKYGVFTLRQWIGAALCVLICVPAYYFLMTRVNQTLAVIVTMALAAPIGLGFFLPLYGLPFEKMFPYIYRSYVHFFQVLKFQTDSELAVEREMLKDKGYRKKLKKLKKLEKANQLKIQRGKASEENQKLLDARADVKDYYNNLRREKIDLLVHGKMKTPLTRKEVKRLKKESRKLSQVEPHSDFETELEAYSNELVEEETEEKNSLDVIQTDDVLSSTISEESTFDDEDNQKRRAKESDKTFENVSSNGHAVITSVTGFEASDSDSDLSEVVISSVKQDEALHSNVSTEIGHGKSLSKRQLVLQYCQEHPEGGKNDCRRVTGVDMKTIKRCWPKNKQETTKV